MSSVIIPTVENKTLAATAGTDPLIVEWLSNENIWPDGEKRQHQAQFNKGTDLFITLYALTK